MTTAAELREDWVRQGWASDQSYDVESVRQSIDKVYARFNRPAPQIVWCDSPWQLVTVPFLMNLVCLIPPEFQNNSNGRIFLEAVREQLNNLDQPLWQQAAKCVKDHLSPELEQSVQNNRRALYDSAYERVGAALGKRLDELKTVSGSDSDFAIPERQRATFQLMFQAGTGIDIKRLGTSSNQIETNLTEPQLHEKKLNETNLQGNEQSVADQLIDESTNVFIWDLGKFAHPWAKIHIGAQLQEQLNEPFREYLGHLLSLESLLATERGAKWQQPPNLYPLPYRPRNHGFPCMPRGRGMPPKFIESVLENERFELRQESAHLISLLGGNESIDADQKISPSHRLFSSDYELLWGKWSTEVFDLLLKLENKHEEQNNAPDEDLEELRDYWDLCQGAFMYVLDAEIVYACRNPTIHLDELGHFHAEDQAAIEFTDGYGFRFIHGTLASETN